MQFNSRLQTTSAPPDTALFAPESALADDCLSFSPSDDNYLSPEWGGDDWGDAMGDDYDGADLRSPGVSSDHQLARLFDGCDDAYAAFLRARHHALYARALCPRCGARRPRRLPRRHCSRRRARLTAAAAGDGDAPGPERLRALIANLGTSAGRVRQ